MACVFLPLEERRHPYASCILFDILFIYCLFFNMLLSQICDSLNTTGDKLHDPTASLSVDRSKLSNEIIFNLLTVVAKNKPAKIFSLLRRLFRIPDASKTHNNATKNIRDFQNLYRKMSKDAKGAGLRYKNESFKISCLFPYFIFSERRQEEEATPLPTPQAAVCSQNNPPRSPVNPSTEGLLTTPVLPPSSTLNFRRSPTKKFLRQDISVLSSKLQESNLKHKKLQRKFAANVSGKKRSQQKVENLKKEIAALKRKNNGVERGGRVDSSVVQNSTEVAEEKPSIFPSKFTSYQPVSGWGGQIIQEVGGSRVFIALPKKRLRPCSLLISPQALVNRALFLLHVLALISGITCEQTKKCLVGGEIGDRKINREIILLLACFFKNRLALLLELCSGASLHILKALSPAQAVNIKCILNLSNNAVRRLRRMLVICDLPIIPSERLMRRHEAESSAPLVAAGGSVETVRLVSGSGEEKSATDVPVYRTKKLLDYVTRVVTRKLADFCIYQGEKLFLLFAGDKGGSYMKFHFSLVSPEIPSSAFQCHVFCIYEGSDVYENMARALEPFWEDLKQLQEPHFQIQNCPIQILFGGDYKFLQALFGHQGATSSFPSLFDEVQLEHLRQHGPKPHNPENCATACPQREVSDFVLNFVASKADDRKKVSGKDHFSITKRTLVPFTSLYQVVPPVLHITLGIVLKLYNLLQKSIMTEDKMYKNDKISVLQKRLGILLEEEKSVTAEHSLMCKRMLDINNTVSRLCAIMQGNSAEIDTIAKNCSDLKIKGVPVLQKCDAKTCIASKFDVDAKREDYIQCDECNAWLHMMCEGLSDEDTLVMGGDESYFCNQCLGQNTYEHASKKFSLSIDKLRDLEGKLASIQDNSSRIRQEIEDAMGPGVTKLNKLLADMAVQRQAFHGNVFVGNHCKVILHGSSKNTSEKNYERLCSVLSDANLRNNFIEIFRLFSKSHHLMTMRNFLSPEEIDRLENLCAKFGELFPKYFPGESLPLKIHDFVFHVPRFVKFHKTLGLFSEEGGESLHRFINCVSRPLFSVRDNAQKLHLIMERFATKCDADNSLEKVCGRKCQCGAFFVKGECSLCDR